MFILLINNSFTTYSNIKAFNCFYSEFCLTLLLLVIVSKILSTKKVLLKSCHYIFLLILVLLGSIPHGSSSSTRTLGIILLYSFALSSFPIIDEQSLTDS